MASLQAQDLGTFGPTWSILEENLLQVIQQKLNALAKTGQLEPHQQRIQQKAIQRIQRPMSVSGIRPTTTPRAFMFDPSITVSDDIRDHQQQLIHPAGTTLNPLHYVKLTHPWLFIDGDDDAQIQWALRESLQAKIVLIQGAPLQLTAQYPNRRFYFDQQGHLVHKLGIQQVPARVTQVGDVLQVEEVRLEPSTLTATHPLSTLQAETHP